METYLGVSTGINTTSYKTFKYGLANKTVQLAVNQPFEKVTIIAGLKKQFLTYRKWSLIPAIGFTCTPGTPFSFTDTAVRKTLLSLQTSANISFSPGNSQDVKNYVYVGGGVNYYSLKLDRIYSESGKAIFNIGYCLSHSKSGYGFTLQFSRQFIKGQYQLIKNYETNYLDFTSFRNTIMIAINKKLPKKKR